MPLRYWRILPFKETLSGASGISRVCILSLCHHFESKVLVRKKMGCIETIAPLQCTVTCFVMFGSECMSLIIVTRACVNEVRMTCTGSSDQHQLHPTPHWPWLRQIKSDLWRPKRQLYCCCCSTLYAVHFTYASIDRPVAERDHRSTAPGSVSGEFGAGLSR